MTQLRWLLLSFMVMVLTGCSEPKLSVLHPEDKVLAFGDSLTAGYGVQPDQSYPAILSQLINRPVINAGISGETTQEGKQRFTELLEQHQPKLVILLEGGNDFLRNRPVETIQQNLQQMIEQAQAQNVQIVLIGVPPKKLFASSHELYEQLAKNNHIPLEQTIIPNLLRRPSMKSDYVHFNEQGYVNLAQAIAELLRDSGAID